MKKVTNPDGTISYFKNDGSPAMQPGRKVGTVMSSTNGTKANGDDRDIRGEGYQRILKAVRFIHDNAEEFNGTPTDFITDYVNAAEIQVAKERQEATKNSMLADLSKLDPAKLAELYAQAMAASGNGTK